MRLHRAAVLFLLTVFAAAFIVSCGSSSESADHRLVSITVSPATATGSAQFKATGNYSTQPLTQTPPAYVHWGSCYNGMPTSSIRVEQDGTAACNSGVSGTFTVWADAPPFGSAPVCNAISACGGGCMVAGTAQLVYK